MTLMPVLIIIAVSIRIIQVRLPVATSLAWLLLVFFLPLVGAIAYLVVGEKRLGRKFTARTQAIKGRYDSWLQDLPPEIRIFGFKGGLLHTKSVVIDRQVALFGARSISMCAVSGWILR
jgi:hypothetical protein